MKRFTAQDNRAQAAINDYNLDLDCSDTDLSSQIRQILLTEWNPIGSSDLPSDEYDAYIPAIELIENLDQLISHLIQLEIDQFFTTACGRRLPHDLESITARATQVAESIINRRII